MTVLMYHIPAEGVYHVPEEGVPEEGVYHVPADGVYHVPQDGGCAFLYLLRCVVVAWGRRSCNNQSCGSKAVNTDSCTNVYNQGQHVLSFRHHFDVPKR